MRRKADLSKRSDELFTRREAPSTYWDRLTLLKKHLKLHEGGAHPWLDTPSALIQLARKANCMFLLHILYAETDSQCDKYLAY